MMTTADSKRMAHLTASIAWQRTARLSSHLDARALIDDDIDDDDRMLVAAIVACQRAYELSMTALKSLDDARTSWAVEAVYDAPGSESGRHIGIATQAALHAASQHLRVATGAETMPQDA